MMITIVALVFCLLVLTVFQSWLKVRQKGSLSKTCLPMNVVELALLFCAGFPVFRHLECSWNEVLAGIVEGVALAVLLACVVLVQRKRLPARPRVVRPRSLLILGVCISAMVSILVTVLWTKFEGLNRDNPWDLDHVFLASVVPLGVCYWLLICKSVRNGMSESERPV
ncbi:MAG: hypothetical protein PHH13_04845 [Candidatus Peribacteraceae bacterium]|nr:hypothetical protein [Candidatus Peribacteraceae bacterium]